MRVLRWIARCCGLYDSCISWVMYAQRDDNDVKIGKRLSVKSTGFGAPVQTQLSFIMASI
jgi:hypothetical protein